MLVQDARDPITGNATNYCPSCGSSLYVIPIVYAVPTPKLRSQQRKGKIIICNTPGGPNTWYCKNCGSEW